MLQRTGQHLPQTGAALGRLCCAEGESHAIVPSLGLRALCGWAAPILTREFPGAKKQFWSIRVRFGR